MSCTKRQIHHNQSWGNQSPWSEPWLSQAQLSWYSQSNVWLNILDRSIHAHVSWALQGCGADPFVSSHSVQSWTPYVHKSNVWQQGSSRTHSPFYLHYLVPINGPTCHGRPSFHILSSWITWHKSSSQGLSWSHRSATKILSYVSWSFQYSDHLQ